MKRNAGIARFCTICAIGLFLIGYQVYGAFSTAGEKGMPVFGQNDNAGIFESDFSSETGESSVGSSTEQQEAESVSSSGTESIETAAVGTVKGKIIERTISSTGSKLSYGKVYVKNSTDLTIDIPSLLNQSLGFTIKKNDQPQVLIMHTHTTETYMTTAGDTYTDAFTSRSRDTAKNMVSVGNIIAEKLNAAGIVTLHDETEHDYPQYTGSYSRAAKTIAGYLEKYPSIRVVLDLHRDAITASGNDKVKLTTEIGGKKAAQVMLVMGSQSGSVTGFPNWKENLKLALRLQQILETDYPTLARPLSLTSKKYNENLTTGSMLIEFGTDANTLSEAHYAAELVGDALVKLLGS